MRRRKGDTAIPPHLAVYTPADWDGAGLEGPEDRRERLRRSRWLEARADWAQQNAPAAWPDLLAELLRYPV